MSNEAGVATAMTILTPIRPGWNGLLRLNFAVARRLTVMTASLVKLSFIHFARWSIIEGFANNGPRHPDDDLQHNYLYFESNFDGTWDQYIDAFAQIVPTRMKALWGSSYGFTGPRPVSRFKAWIRRNEYTAQHYYNAYPEATTTMIVSALELRDAFDEFAQTAADLDPDEFAVAWERFVTDQQHNL